MIAIVFNSTSGISEALEGNGKVGDKIGLKFAYYYSQAPTSTSTRLHLLFGATQYIIGAFYYNYYYLVSWTRLHSDLSKRSHYTCNYTIRVSYRALRKGGLPCHTSYHAPPLNKQQSSFCWLRLAFLLEFRWMQVAYQHVVLQSIAHSCIHNIT